MTPPVHAGPPVKDVTAVVRAAAEVSAAAEVVNLADLPTDAQVDAALAAERKLALLAGQPSSQANAVTAVVGDSGSGKTTLITTAIEYCWETYHKKSRYYAGDLGGYGNRLLALVKLGICETWNLVNHHEPFETVELASMGYWPERIDVPETGFADPFVKLVAPQRRVYTVYCASGHAQPPVADKRQLAMYQAKCPTCGTIVTLQTLLRIEEQVIRSKGFKNIGLWIYESGSSLSDHAMNDMADRAGRDELGGEKGAMGKVVSGDMTFGSNNRAHYGFAQLRVRQWLANSRRIPGQVVPPLWSFLLDRGSDEKNSPVYGPKIAGSAKTAEAASWVGNLLHAEKVKDDRTQLDVHRLWVTAHRNAAEGNVLYLAKHRADPSTFDTPYLQDAPDEPRFTKFSLGYFYRALDSSLAVSTKRAGERYPDAPALVPMDDDEEVIVTTTADPGSMAHVGGPAPSVGGVPAAMLPPPGVHAGPQPPPGVAPTAPPPPQGAIVGGPVPPAGARPAVPTMSQGPVGPVIQAPATVLVGVGPIDALKPAAPPVTMPTPAGPMPVPASMLPFVSRPIPAREAITQAAAVIAGDPPVMAPASAPIRPPVPSKK